MSTSSTDNTERPRASWLRRLGLPALAAVAIGAVAGGAYYYFVELRNPGVRRTNPAVARRVASTHTLVSIGGVEDTTTPAFALIGRAGSSHVLVPVSPSLVVEVPGLGPRTIALALRDAGPGAAAVALANTLRVTVPSSMAATNAAVATTADEVGGVEVTVPRTLRTFTNGVLERAFSSGPTHMTGADFVRFMTGRYAEETQLELDARQSAGWRGFLTAVAGPGGKDLLRGWTTDIAKPGLLRLLRESAPSPVEPRLPVSAIGLAGERLVRIDEARLADFRQTLADWSNGAETVDGRRIRLIVAADGPLGPLVGRILVNAGYVVEISGKAAKPAATTRIAVSPAITDAEATGKDLEGLLGTGSVRVSTDSDTAADIMLVIGMDWAEANGFPQR